MKLFKILCIIFALMGLSGTVLFLSGPTKLLGLANDLICLGLFGTLICLLIVWADKNRPTMEH